METMQFQELTASLASISGVAKATIAFRPVPHQQTLFTSTAMKETIFFAVEIKESTKPSKVVKVMIKSALYHKSSTLTELMTRPALITVQVKRMDMVFQ